MEELNHKLSKVEITTASPNSPKIMMNRGTGAGGSLTNANGKAFECLTDNESKLIDNGFIKVFINGSKFGYYLFKNDQSKSINGIPRKIVFVKQNGLKLYLKKIYLMETFRCPDEAYIITNGDGTIHLKILEKKEQSVSGSVETKLWSAPSLKREYELSLDSRFIVSYALCVNSFLQAKINSKHKKYIILDQILQENKITVLYGNDSSYFTTLSDWLNAI